MPPPHRTGSHERQCDVYCVSNMPFPSTAQHSSPLALGHTEAGSHRNTRFPGVGFARHRSPAVRACSDPHRLAIASINTHHCQAPPVGTSSFSSLGAYTYAQHPQCCPTATHQQTQRAFFAGMLCKPAPPPDQPHMAQGSSIPPYPAHRMLGKAWAH